MAEIQQKDSGSKKKGKQKKMDIHVDFTPMVDMNMLLICFFMLATTMSKPQTMEISMPTKDKVAEAEQTKVADDRAVTVLLNGNNELYYYAGEPDYEDFNSLTKTNYTASGLRTYLIGRNKEMVRKIDELKQRRANLQISDEDYEKESAEIKKEDKFSPVVIIKATDGANYENLIDVLDEMQICSISKYAIVDITPEDMFLIENYKTKGNAERPAEEG
ncbi:biopolymer transporter ExbD [Bacteroidales bacterium OttesenSCG-928-I21]|nr:biopolymer transporter ExbD [Bacteroidales bacterium OttesenSCG-928-I21]